MPQTYPECAPSVDLAGRGQGKRRAVAGDDLHPGGVLGHVRGVDLGGGALLGVHAGVVLVVGFVLVFDVPQTAVPGGVAAEGALVVDAPRQDLVVFGQRGNVHATAGDLDDALEVWVEARALDIDGLLAVDADAAEAELASGALAKNKNVHDLAGDFVDRLELARDALGRCLGSGHLSLLFRSGRGLILLRALGAALAVGLDIAGDVVGGLLVILFVALALHAVDLGGAGRVLLVGLFGGLRNLLLGRGRSGFLGGSGLLGSRRGFLCGGCSSLLDRGRLLGRGVLLGYGGLLGGCGLAGRRLLGGSSGGSRGFGLLGDRRGLGRRSGSSLGRHRWLCGSMGGNGTGWEGGNKSREKVVDATGKPQCTSGEFNLAKRSSCCREDAVVDRVECCEVQELGERGRGILTCQARLFWAATRVFVLAPGAASAAPQ